MALLVFGAVLVLSVIIALMSKKGAIGSSMDDVMTASGSFGAFLIFFVSVGEIYSIGTMIGAPGSVYAKGATYGMWFICYILLSYVLGYFLNPSIWRMGQLAKAVSIGDLIGWRYNSKALQVIVALVGIGFLTPWIQNQFAGMAILFEYLDIGVTFFAGVLISSALAFAYIAIAGIRAPAWVSVLKDFLLIVSIVTVGIAAVVHMDGGVGGIFRTVAETRPDMLIIESDPITKNVTFVMSTIAFQMLGFYMLPISFQALLTSKNEKNLRKNTIYMPMYMIMFPFLIIAAYYAVATIPNLENQDFALLAIVVETLPDWCIGLVAGAGALTAILVMAITALCVGGLFSKNILGVIKPDMPQSKMAVWTRVATGVFLVFGVLTALYFPALMANVVTLAYGGLSQTFFAVALGFVWKKATKWGMGAGIITGVGTLAFIINVMDASPLGMNPGFWAIVMNLVVVVVVSLFTKPDAETTRRFELYRSTVPNRVK
ncbi:MAG: sodium:solute symporter family protein [Anaerovorax sp.]